MIYLGYEEDRLKDLGGYWTAREIMQQPASWLRTYEYLIENAPRINRFLEPILARSDLRIILTGAGTSGFAGECLAPLLSRSLNRQFEAIATTDLVSGPENHFRPEVPTLLISFARSGNSPESVAAVELADTMLKECYQLGISCNADGELYRLTNTLPNSLALLMPEETNDRAFAMTSSFSSMLLAAIAVFTGVKAFAESVSRIASVVHRLMEARNDEIRELAQANFNPVVYLGSNGLAGLAREASLKLLELTDGHVMTMHESPLGVRHGPKSILNEDALVVIFMSADSYTRKYDKDILHELIDERQVKRIVALTAAVDLDHSMPQCFVVEKSERFTDLELLFPYVVFAQMYGFHQAIKIGNRPDTPNASGTVNRVVKGVKIHACTF